MEMWMDRTESHIITLKVLRYFREWGYLPYYNTIRLWGGSEVKKSIIQKFGLLRAKDIEIVGRSDRATDDVLKNKCHVLYASRSSLEAFADALDKRKVEFRPRIVVSTGEMLMKEHRERFREIFGCATLNHYASEELGTIAWGCPDQHHNLHIDMETVLINFRNVVAQSKGKMGSIILTNLENFTMPFIRYDQGDKILIPKNDQCSCGRTLPILGQVFGRNEDVLDYHGRKYYWNFFYNIIENFLYIKKYKIVQMKKGTIEFRILLFQNKEETRKKCISDLNSAFKDHFSPVNIRFVDDFPLQSNRKFKVLEKET
jgi:phenylacetate-CoA ligase